jgi:hypothetical protein
MKEGWEKIVVSEGRKVHIYKSGKQKKYCSKIPGQYPLALRLKVGSMQSRKFGSEGCKWTL